MHKMIFAAVALALAASAETVYTWTGAAGAVNGYYYWNTPGNWQDNVVPQSGDDVILDFGTTPDADRVAAVMEAVGLLIMVVIAVLPLLNIFHPWLKWAFFAGALIVLVGRFFGAYNGPELRLKRLHRIRISSGILYLASAVMMLIPDTGNNWLGFLLAGVVVQMYASWMIDKEMKKTEK